MQTHLAINRLPVDSAKVPISAPRVLVCDDEPHVLHAVKFKLTSAGLRVTPVSDAREAIAWLSTNTPDLVITDIEMRSGSGFEICRFLRSRPRTASVPIILLTARALEISHEAIREQWNIETLLMKPFSPRALLESVQTALKLPRTE